MKKVIGVAIATLIIILIIAGITANKQSRGYSFIEYTVTAGDTLWNIAIKYGADDMDVRETVFYIQQDNNLKDSEIYPDMILKIRKYEREDRNK